jgi:hypothetical protein
MVYITPSQDMVVRPGQHVSGDGRVYHPYLAQWEKYWDVRMLWAWPYAHWRIHCYGARILLWAEIHTLRLPGRLARRFC